ncbi:hypothetical protein ACJX0J_038372, partial [Zea mays]
RWLGACSEEQKKPISQEDKQASSHEGNRKRLNACGMIYFYRRIRLSTDCAIFSGGFLRKPPLKIGTFEGEVDGSITNNRVAREFCVKNAATCRDGRTRGREACEGRKIGIASKVCRCIPSMMIPVVYTKFRARLAKLQHVYKLLPLSFAGRYGTTYLRCGREDGIYLADLFEAHLSIQVYTTHLAKNLETPARRLSVVHSAISGEEAENYYPYLARPLSRTMAGEPRAALNLASYGGSHALKLSKEDVFLYSAKVIPRNETRVMKMMDRLTDLGPKIIMGKDSGLHTSRHAYREELVNFQLLFLKEHESLGRSTGIRHITVIKNGEMLGVSHLRNRRVLSNGFVSLGKEDLQLMYSDGDKAFGTSTDLCIDERLRIASDGIIFVGMEIFRPQKEHGLTQTGLKGKFKITTRCLWLDNGRLLDALYKAAHAALSSCPVNYPLSHMERMVAEILRKMVRKYSEKRPDVIAVAMENTTTSFSKHLDAKSSRNFEPSSATSHLSRSPAMSLEGSYKTHPDNPEVDAEETLPEATRTTPDDATTSSNGEAFFSSDLHQPKTLEHLWESFKSPIAVKIARIVNGGKKQNLGKIGIMGKDSSIQSTPAPAKSSKKNKWKPEEIKSLIQMHGEMNERFQSVKGRMVLWEEISDNMLKQGISRTPAQCKSLWTSLVQKYE